MAVNQWCYGEDEGQQKSSFHTSKGWLENFMTHISLHNVKRIGGSVSADHVAGTKYRAFQEDNQGRLLSTANL